MIFHVLASDYDGTIAENGTLSERTVRALRQARASGRKLILVTGRILANLACACPQVDQIFDGIVGENGGVFKICKTQEVRALGPAPEAPLLAALGARGLTFSTGMCSIHLAAADADLALAAIRETGVGRTLIFNRGSLMLLPSNVAKGSGLAAALAVLGGSLHNTAGIGDGENDHAFLDVCEFSVAVGNAVPALRERADYVTRAPGPLGSVEFIEEHLLTDMPALVRHLPRHQIRLGERDGTPVTLPVHGTNLLIVDPSGAGESRLASVLVERLVDSKYSVVLLDPEGEYDGLTEMQGMIRLGDKKDRTLPTRPGLEQLLRQTATSLVLNLSAMSRPEKVAYGKQALTALAAVRKGSGLPHWIVVAQAHQLMPSEGAPPRNALSSLEEGLCLITRDVNLLPGAVRRLCNTLASVNAEEFGRGLRALTWQKWNNSPKAAPLIPREMLLIQKEAAADAERFFVDRRRSPPCMIG